MSFFKKKKERGPAPAKPAPANATQGARPPTEAAPAAPTSPPSHSSSGSLSRPNIVYPWSLRAVSLLPPALLPESNAPAPNESPSPFPRYGHSVNPVASSASGDLYVFGGLVGEHVRNDLFVLQCVSPNTNTVPVGLVETKGDVPSPRVGHASVGVGNVLIVWGGDTKADAADVQDPGLYLLNLSTREWTLVKISGNHPVGRYGHAAAMIGSRFYVFGGQKDDGDFLGGFLNDLWSFDLQKLKDGSPRWDEIEPAPRTSPPPCRMGHTVVTYGDCLYVFGGTDGSFHYNDTWRFDTNTSTWSELSCHGYIPLQREGHASTLVDDVMYVFGGRGTDGLDLNDLAAFKISNQRWYMFQNMGPSPSARSGHTMATWQNKIFVLGGESFSGPRKDDPSRVHVLDTGKIKYPPDNNRQTMSQNSVSQGEQGSQQGPSEAAMRARSPTGGTQSVQVLGNVGGSDSGAPNANQPNGSSNQYQDNGNGVSRGAMSPFQQTSQPPPNAVPQRPRRPSETNNFAAGSTDSVAQRVGGVPASQAMAQQPSHPQQQPPSSNSQADIVSPTRAISPTSRAMSPSKAMSPVERTTSPSFYQQQSQPQQRSRSPIQGQQSHHAQPGSLDQQFSSISSGLANKGAFAQSPPNKTAIGVTNPDLTENKDQDDDAFYFSSDQNKNVTSSDHEQPFQSSVHNIPPNASSPPSSFTSSPSHSRQNLLSSQRQASASTHSQWLSSALALAVQKGFSLPDEHANSNEYNESKALINDATSLPQSQAVLEALVTVKRDLAKSRSALSEQAKSTNSRIMESTQARAAAQQEAAYYRSKAYALESGSASGLAKIERERASECERKLADSLKDAAEYEKRMVEAEERAKRETEQRRAAEEREYLANQRADAVETSYSRSLTDYADLQRKHHLNDSTVQKQAEQIDSLNSALERIRDEHAETQSRMETSDTSLEQYLRTMEQTQATLIAANAQADEMEGLWNQSKAEVDEARDEITKLRSELDTKNNESRNLSSKCAELEKVLKVTKEEVGSMRSLTASGLSDLIKSTRSSRSMRDENGIVSGSSISGTDREGSPSLRISALKSTENELAMLKSRHEEHKTRSATVQQELQDTRARVAELEQQCTNFRSEAAFMRRLHGQAVEEANRHKTELSRRENDVDASVKSLEAAEMKMGLMRSLMVENGLAVNDSDLDSEVSKSTSTQSLSEINAQLSKHVRELQDQLDQARLPSSSSSATISSKPKDEGVDSGENSKEEELSELQERHRQLEATHVKAVSYVKGTEKMLRKMKEEVNKHKERNEVLEGQLAAANADRSGSADGRATPSRAMMGDFDAMKSQLEDLRTISEKSNNENEELQRRMLALQAEYDKTLQEQEEESSSKIESLEGELDQLERDREKVQRDLSETLALNRQLNEQLKSALKGPSGTGNGSPSGDGQADVAQLEANLQAADNKVQWLRRENSALEARCRESENKITILLDAWEGGSRDLSGSPSGHGHSPLGTDTSTQEMTPWGSHPKQSSPPAGGHSVKGGVMQHPEESKENGIDEETLSNRQSAGQSIRGPNGIRTMG